MSATSFLWSSRWCGAAQVAPTHTHARAHPHAEIVDIPFSTCMTGGQFAPPSTREREEREAQQLFWKWPLSFRQRLCSCQEPWLKMTDSVVVEGYARLREGKKVFYTFGFKRTRLLHGYSCLCVFWSFSLLTWFLLQWKNRWLVLRKPSPVAGTIPPILSELLKYDVN